MLDLSGVQRTGGLCRLLGPSVTIPWHQRGLSTEEIAATLSIALLTVQQHLKAVFEKTGVRSRRELTAQLLAQQCLPRIASGARVAADGWFATEPTRRP